MRSTSAVVAAVLLGAALAAAANPTFPTLTMYAGSGSSASADGTGTMATFMDPIAVRHDAATSSVLVSDWSAHVVRRIMQSTAVVTTWAGTVGTSGWYDDVGTAATFFNPWGLSVTSAGVAFLAEYSNHMIREISANATVTQLAGNRSWGDHDNTTGTAARFNGPRGVALESSSTTLYVADALNNKVRAVAVADGATTTLAGSGATGYADGTGAAATFYAPTDIVAFSTTTLYVADYSANRIRKIVIATGAVTALAGSSAGSSGSTDATGSAARFHGPAGIAVDANEYLYVADYRNSAIRIVSNAGVVTTAVFGATLVGPYGIEITSAGYAYIADLTASKVYGFEAAGTTDVPATAAPTAAPVTDTPTAIMPMLPPYTYTTGSNYGAASTTAAYGYVNGDVNDAKFKGPWGVAYDASTGGLVVSDNFDHRIRRISAAFIVSTFAGSGVTGSTDGLGEAATFYYPTGATVTAGGVSYIADKSNHNIRAITAYGVVTTLAGSGMSGSVNGIATAASFSYPYGVVELNATEVYVADSLNYKIRKVTVADGTTTTHAGSGAYARTDGASASCAFKYPYGVAASSAGVVYVADKWSQAIRKVLTTGWTTTLAGSLVGTSGNVDAFGSDARFYYPHDVSVTDTGYVFVADSSNNALRIVSPGGNVTTVSTVALTAPRGVQVTSEGNVYIGCYNSEKVTAYTGGTITPTTFAPTATPTTMAPASASGAGAALAAALAVAYAVLA
jgi:sugar lactone lactonase YvrE